MYATDDVGDAIQATRAFVLPFDVRRWLRLAFVTFFLGGLGVNFSTPSVGSGPGDMPTAGPPEDIWLVVGALVALAVVVGLAFAAVRGVMDFVLLQSLREEEVRIQQFWRAHWRQGLRLFGFRLAVSLVALTLLGVPFGLVFLGAQAGSTALLALGLLVLLPVLLVVPAVAPLVKGFTTAFVAPVMLLEGGGVLDAWRRFWPMLRREWREFAGYAVVNFVLLLAAAAVLSLGTLVGAVGLVIPLVPVVGVGFLVGQAVPLAGVAVFAVSGVVYGVAVIVVAAFVKAPLVVFLRYYALFVLGDVDGGFDLIPETRRQTRAEAD